MNLTRRLNQILQVRPGQKVPERHKFAMIFVLYIYHAPSILAPANRATTGDNVFLGADNGEGDKVLHSSICGAFFFVVLVIVVGEHA